MSTPISVLGFLGVNNVDAPFALADGELQSAQNAELFKAQGRLSLRSRAGLVEVAAVGLGAINGIAALPLDPPIVGTAANAKHRIYAALTTGWLKSLNAGTTFAATTDLARTQSTPFAFPGSATGAWSAYVGIKTSAQLGNRFFYYMSDGSGAIFVYGFDGEQETPLARLVASVVTAQPMFTGEGRVHLVVKQAAGSALVALDPVTGTPERLIAALAVPEMFTGGVYYQGRLWAITALHALGARLLTARPADVAWTVEVFNGSAAPTVVTYSGAAISTLNLITGVGGQQFIVTKIVLTSRTGSGSGTLDVVDEDGGAVSLNSFAQTGFQTQTFGAGFAVPVGKGLKVVGTGSLDWSQLTMSVYGYFGDVTPLELGFTSIAHYAAAGATSALDLLYLTTFSTSDHARVLARDYAGVYTTALNSPDTSGGATSPVFYSHLTRYGTDLYVIYTVVVTGGVTVCKVFKTSDGVTWTEDKNLLSDGGACVANVQVIGTDLYVACVANASLSGSAAGLWRRRAGSWTKVSTEAIAGPLGLV